MKNSFSRREFVQSGAVAAGFAATGVVPALMGVAQAGAEAIPASGKFSPLSLGVASYTFRNFTRAQLIGFMKQLNLTALNCKDVKDHLPMDPTLEAQRLGRLRGRGHQASRRRHRLPSPRTMTTTSAASSSTPSARASRDRGRRSRRQPRCRASRSLCASTTSASPSTTTGRRTRSTLAVRCAEGGQGYGPAHRLLHRHWPRVPRAGTNRAEAIHAVGPRLYDMHVKDLTQFRQPGKPGPVGEGILPFREIFEALIKIGYEGFVDLEYEIHADDPMPGVIESFAFMRGVIRRDGVFDACVRKQRR
jgi:hypothetical protein